ncbi:MAG TPA: DALR domain-containing protein, partial [Gaiellaceae bacterium]|nr:DALR domain-containing protein [Gaiellaceae bacterium]
LIGDLIDRGLAYESGGDVYFRVPAYPAYGELSGAQPDEMIAQEPGDLKEDPRDFALWKATKAHEDTEWESPWGPGRPGWHIECSAMAEKHLGPEFEIHGGGLDLRFPHHENELAQSRGAGRPFARHWAHNGMLQLSEEKMSKSLGNIVSLREALDRWGRETVLVYFLGGHWRKPIDFSEDALAQAAAQAESFRNARLVIPNEAAVRDWDSFEAELDDDFNTPAALALMHEWRSAGRLDLLARAMLLFGLELPLHPEAPADVEKLADKRFAARAARNFDEADRLRAEIEALGWEMQDLPDGGYRLVARL